MCATCVTTSQRRRDESAKPRLSHRLHRIGANSLHGSPTCNAGSPSLPRMHADRRRTRGELGEQIAERHLERRGYRVLERNFRTRYGEIDLIAVDPRAIVFCEVKTRVSYGRAGPAGPLDAIGFEKRRRVRMIARQWLA